MKALIMMLDYLQKPIAIDRFNASVKRAIDLHLKERK
jgi:DNA-binding NtrC family response regulator